MKITNVLLAAAATAMFSFSAQAVDRLYVNDITVDNYEVKQLPVMFENDGDVKMLQFKVTIPAGFQVNGNPSFNTEVVTDEFMMPKIWAEDQPDGTTLVQANILSIDSSLTFKAGDAAVCYIPIQAKTGTLDEGGSEALSIFDIMMVGTNGTNVAENTTVAGTINYAKFVKESYVNIVCSNAPILVNPGDTRNASISMDCGNPIQLLQFRITPPEHTKIANLKKTSRIPAGTSLSLRHNEANGYYTAFVLCTSGAVSAGSGDLVTFDIVADNEFFTSGDVVINNVVYGEEGSDKDDNLGNGSTFLVESGYVAFEQAAAAIEELNEYLTKANNTIENECPLVAEDYSVFLLYQEVAALQAAIEKAYNDYTLTPDYASVVTAPIAALKEKIDAHVAAAKEAQAKEEKRRADNKAAYEADLNAIAALQTALDEAKAQVREQYPNFVDEEAENAIQADIDAAKAAVEAAYKAVETEGNYDYKLDADAITSDIANLLPAAAAAAAEADRVAANQKAYNDDLAAIDALQAALDAAKEQVREQYPGFADEDAEDAIQKQIDALKEGAAAALKAVETEGNYDYSFNADEITAEIAQLLPEAAEAYRVDFNEKAYNADIAAIDELVKKYNEAKDEIDALNPSFLEGNKDAEDILSQIDAAREACDKEYDSVKEEGFYESPAEFDAKAIEDSINALLEGVMTGIGVISADMDLTGVEIYTLDGMRHSKLVIGQINILKTEKQVRKVVVK